MSSSSPPTGPSSPSSGEPWPGLKRALADAIHGVNGDEEQRALLAQTLRSALERLAMEAAESDAVAEPVRVLKTLSIGGVTVEVEAVDDPDRIRECAPKRIELPPEPEALRRRSDRSSVRVGVHPAVPAVIAARAGLQADLTRLEIEIRDGGETEAVRERSLRQRKEAGRLPDFAAFAPSDRGLTLSRQQLVLVAETYTNARLGAELAMEVAREGITAPLDVLYLLAETQSSLRAALLPADQEADPDQLGLFGWVRDRGAELGVFIDRHLRRGDEADPTEWQELRERLVGSRERLVLEQQDEAERLELLERLRHALDQNVGSSNNFTDALVVLEQWIARGRPASSLDLVELVEPFEAPLRESGNLSEEALRVLEALAERRESLQAAGHVELEDDDVHSPHVLEAARLLKGKVVVFFGGEVRWQNKRALEAALQLDELRWIPTRPHRSLDPLITQLRRPEVDLVVVAKRWSDHAFADLADASKAAGKVFVNLPAGFGTNQFAHQVLEQVSDQLAR